MTRTASLPKTTSANVKLFSFTGGFDGSMPLNTAEYYDPKIGKWTEISRMNQCRFGVGCAVLHDMVYAVGGTDGTNLKTVERYDPELNTWTMVASMSTARFVSLCVKITDQNSNQSALHGSTAQ